MNKQTFTELNVVVDDGVKAVGIYGADRSVFHPTVNKAYYNVGVDSVITDIAAIALKEMELDLDKYESKLDSYQLFQTKQNELLENASTDEMRESIEEYHNIIFDWITQMKQEYFQRGFNAGYKLAKNAESR